MGVVGEGVAVVGSEVVAGFREQVGEVVVGYHVAVGGFGQGGVVGVDFGRHSRCISAPSGATNLIGFQVYKGFCSGSKRVYACFRVVLL